MKAEAVLSLPPFLRRKRLFVLLYSAISTILGLVFPLVVKNLISALTENKSSDVFFRICLVGLGIETLSMSLNWLQNYQWHKLGKECISHFRITCFSQALLKPFSFFRSNNESDIVSRIVNDTEYWGVLKAHASLMLILNVTNIAAILGFMSYVDVRLTCVIIVFAPLYYLYYLKLNKSLRKLATKERESYSQTLGIVQEKISAAETIKLNQSEPFFIGKVRAAIDSLFHTSSKLQFYKSFGSSVNSYFLSLLPLFVLALGGFFIYRDMLALPALLAFYLYIPNLREPIVNLTDLNLSRQNALAVKERLSELVENSDSVVHEQSAYRINEIAFEDVTFAYDADKLILDNVSLTLRRGDRVRLQGISGAGKTTLLRLLLGIEQPGSGSVKINGVPLTQIEGSAYLKDVSYMSQFPFLFSGSVLENLRFDNDCSADKIRESLRISGADRFVCEETDLDSTVEMSGGNFSGGEKQRLALARAMLKDAGVIILDEPTSALDAEIESDITASLETYFENNKDNLLIVISHGRAFDKLCGKTLSVKKDGTAELM